MRVCMLYFSHRKFVRLLLSVKYRWH